MRTFGKYRLVEPIASGGMADVWRAEVSGAEGVVKEVALKLVRGEHGDRSDFVRMFIQEARLAARLTHANVVQVFEFDQVEGRYYIAMELVHGWNLGRVAARARELGLRFGLPRAVHVGAEVAKGLAYAHRLSERGRPVGLVHRDVSPHNILVSHEGEVKLADFGIARAVSRAELTAPGTVKGKLAYMAPEQARGGAVDARADVFSLGVVLWELCAGRRLFDREGDAATLAALLEPDPLSPPSAWNEDVPPELDEVIMAALERDPARRTASAEELARALAAALHRLARSPEEWDLRALMRRLWPEGAAGEGAVAEATRVRPVPVAAEPVATQPPVPGAGLAPAPPLPPAREPLAGPAPAALDEATGATRTTRGPAPRLLRRRRLAAAASAVALVILALGLGAMAARRAASRPAATRPAEAVAPPAPAGVEARPAGGRAEAGLPAVSPEAAAPAMPPRSEAPAPASGDRPAPSAGASGEGSGPAASPPPPAAAAPAVTPAEPGPATATRPGVLHVTASPWAHVTVGGKDAGETPVTLALPPGRHRVRAAHPRYGERETTVVIVAGRRAAWHVNLAR